jgi:hypothetical protein
LNGVALKGYFAGPHSMVHGVSSMSKRHSLSVAASFVLCAISGASAQQPTTAQFEQTLDARLQQLRPDGMTVRADSAPSSRLTFRGGFLDGQVGKTVRANGFSLSSTVSCEPWR